MSVENIGGSTPTPSTPALGHGVDETILKTISKNLDIEVTNLTTEEGNTLLQVSGNFGDSFVIALEDPAIDPAKLEDLIEDAINKIVTDIGTLSEEVAQAEKALESNNYMGQMLAIMKLIMTMTQDQELKLMELADQSAMDSFDKTIQAIDKDVAAALTRLVATAVSSGLTIAAGAGQIAASSKIQPDASFGGKHALHGQAMGQISQALSRLIDSIGAYEAAKQEGEAGELRALGKLDQDLKEHTEKAAKAMRDAFEEALKVLESIWRSSTQAANDVTNMA